MDAPCLVVTTTPVRGQGFTLKDACQWTLGNDSRAQLRIRDLTIAPLHARIAYSDGEWQASSLSKESPFYVNDEPVYEAVLEHRDRLRFGRIELMLLLD